MTSLLQPPSLIKILAIVLGLTLLLAYLLVQSRFLLLGPQLTLKENDIIQTARVATLSGTAENIVFISINGRPIMTEMDGRFTEDVILHDGVTTVSLLARDRYGRTAQLEKIFVYKAPRTLSQNNH